MAHYDRLKEDITLVMDRLHPKNFNERYNKDNRKNLLHQYSSSIFKWVVERGHKQRNVLDELCELMSNVKVAKTLKKLIKEYNSNEYFEDSEDKIGIEFVVVINEILTRLKQDDEAYIIYYQIATDLLESRVEKMVKRAKISEKLAMNLLLIVPKPEIVLRDNIVGIYVNRVVRRMYSFAYNTEDYTGLPEDTESLKVIFKMLFGKARLDEVVTSLALERRPVQNNNQGESYKRLHSLITDFVLEYYEGMKPKKLKEQLLNFVDRRIKDREQKRDGSRRFQPSTLNKADYENIHKTIKKINKKHQDFSEFF